MGCKIKSISLKYSSLGVSAYQVVAPAECSSNLSRFDGGDMDTGLKIHLI